MDGKRKLCLSFSAVFSSLLSPKAQGCAKDFQSHTGQLRTPQKGRGGWHQELLSPRSMFPAIQTSVVCLKWIDCSCPDVSGSPQLPKWLFPLENWRLSCTSLIHQVSQGISMCYYPLFCCYYPLFWALAVGDQHKPPLQLFQKLMDKTWKMLLRNETIPSAHHYYHLP